MVKIIAEFCQNHCGDFDVLGEMVEAAAKAGATHGKMQTIFAENLVYRPQFEEGVVQDGQVRAIKRPYKDEYERLKGLEITQKESEEFVRLCGDHGIVPITTCFASTDIDQIYEAGFRSIKVASYDCGSFPMLRLLADKFDEIIVSTGASFDDEIEHAAAILKGANFSFLHCVTIYPTPLEEVHLLRMEWLRQFTSHVGFSDHSLVASTGLLASKAALLMGANVIERHFTTLPSSETRDGPVSINTDQLQEIVEFSKLSAESKESMMRDEHPGWEVVKGQRTRNLSHEELLNRDYYRGRFASQKSCGQGDSRMIYNWEENPSIRI